MSPSRRILSVIIYLLIQWSVVFCAEVKSTDHNKESYKDTVPDSQPNEINTNTEELHNKPSLRHWASTVELNNKPSQFWGICSVKDKNDYCNALDGLFGTNRGGKENKKSKRTKPIVPGEVIFSINGWRFKTDNTLERAFAIDPDERNIVRRKVKKALFSRVNSTAFKSQVKLAAVSEEVLQDFLQLDPSEAETPEFLHVFSGNGQLAGAQPLAQRYGGHQFGYWADQLGDGRAHTLGEVTGRSKESWEIQLKGSGKTPYSRDGDGRAVIRSSVREFLASEAMHYLGVPTSRAGSLIVSDDRVIRDMFYTGDRKWERIAVVMRLARSWMRFGTIELLSRNKENKLLRSTLDTIICRYFPDISSTNPHRYLAFFAQVLSSTAQMVAKWMSVGFAHGVMNTDNFSLHGVTIDYGPFRFLDAYDPDLVPNTSDDEGRYTFGKQPDVAYRNLQYLAEALKPVLDREGSKQLAQLVLTGFKEQYRKLYLVEMRQKLGVHVLPEDDARDSYMLNVLLGMMEDNEADFTMTFRELSEWKLDAMSMGNIPEQFWSLSRLSRHELWHHFLLELYIPRIQEYDELEGWTDDKRMRNMKSVNPRYVLRNWMAQKAIEAIEQNDNFQPLRMLLHILQKPYTQQRDAEDLGYAKSPPKWAEELRVSCSS